MSTGIGSGIAIPHGYCRSINTIIGAIGISKPANSGAITLMMAAKDAQEVHAILFRIH